MNTTKQNKVFTIRELMPRNYLLILEKRTKATKSAICRVVKKENTDSDIWPAVIQLAEETKAQRLQDQERLRKLKNAA